MHSIDELIFHPFLDRDDTEEASLLLKNGYTVKVIKGALAAHTYGAPYELSISPTLKEITEDSVGYLSEIDLLRLINEIENFPKLRSYK